MHNQDYITHYFYFLPTLAITVIIGTLILKDMAGDYIKALEF